MLRHNRPVRAAVIALAVLLATSTPAGAAEVDNGSFETGDFDGWTVEDEPGSAGDWFVYTGISLPEANNELFAPPCGEFAAVTAQGDPSSQVLYQDLVLEDGMTHTLSMQLSYINNAEDFVNPDPDTLSIQTQEANQQYRVEIIDPEADPFSVDPDDILLEIFRTQPGDPLSMDWTEFADVDLSEFAGQTVRLRFAEADTESFFNAAADCVELVSEPIATTTTSTTVAPAPTVQAARPAAVTAATPAFTG
jgi:hypothetical protein